MKEFTIGYRQAGQRLDKYLEKLLRQAPKSFIYKMLRKKNIVLNGKKASGSEILKESDSVRIWFSDETFAKFSAPDQKGEKTISAKKPDPLQCPVIYEDKDILILNKPQGMLSQKADAGDYSMNEWMIDYLLASGNLTREDLLDFRPSVCNRLDRNTSGLILAGKTVHGLQWAGTMLKDRSMQKYYRCIVKGEIRRNGYQKKYLIKDPSSNRVNILDEPITGSQPIETAWEPVSVFRGYTDLEVHLITGRSHQIRAQFSAMGYPLLGDPKYGERAENACWKKSCGIRAQLLHAYRMRFPDGRVFTADIPENFRMVLKKMV